MHSPFARLRAALFVAFAALLAPAESHAFGTDFHADLAREAWRAEATTLGDATCAGVRCRAFAAGTEDEDFNSPSVKWLRVHHYHRPGGGPATTFREGPAARVAELWREALQAARSGDEARAWDRVGHIVHFVQDMASPPHVVPVEHALGDGFERLADADVLGPDRIAALAGTREPPLALGPGDALDAVATRTLVSVRSEGALTDDGTLIPWSAYWDEGTQPGGWGAYGRAGNAFGAEAIVVDGVAHRVDRERYREFALARAADAVEYTRAFLRWAAPQLERPGGGADTVWRAPPQHFVAITGGLSGARAPLPAFGLRAGLALPRGLALEGSWLRPVVGSGLDRATWSLGASYLLGSRWIGGAGGAELLVTAGGGRVGAGLGGQAGAAIRISMTAWLQARVDATAGASRVDHAWSPAYAVTTALGVHWGDP